MCVCVPPKTKAEGGPVKIQQANKQTGKFTEKKEEETCILIYFKMVLKALALCFLSVRVLLFRHVKFRTPSARQRRDPSNHGSSMPRLTLAFPTHATGTATGPRGGELRGVLLISYTCRPPR